MAWETLKAAIAQVIKTNGNQEITGYLLQQELFRIVDNVGAPSGYLGKATPSTDPGTQDGNVFYIATEIGTYVNFNNLVISQNGIYILKKINGSWSLETIYSSGLFRIGTYLTAPSDPIALLANTNNKISLAVSLVTNPLPYGFDIYVTPQGTALRFVGSGLGNGDSAVLRMDTMAGLKASTGFSNKVIMKAMTRPYTETDFANAVDLPGYAISRKMPNNDLGAVALNAPFFTVNDGDLLEIVIRPDTDISIIVDTFGFEAVQLKY